MIGDELSIEPYHTKMANKIYRGTRDEVPGEGKYVISIGGESGSGKSELAHELRDQFQKNDVPTVVLQQDDYFVFPPKTNRKMRKKNVEQVGLYEVKLHFLESNLRSFKRDDNPLYKPLVVYDQDLIKTEELDTSSVQTIIVEGTYTTILQYVDLRIFIDLDYRQTYHHRQKRGREELEPFLEDVLEREHKIISGHRERADLIVGDDYETLSGPYFKSS